MKPAISDLIHDIPPLGSYSGVIAEINAILANPNSTLSDMGRVIGTDPDLASRLLKIGNSAFYAYSRRLETVDEAITLIGIVQVQDLIMGSSVVDAFEGISPAQVNMESFWKHSLACGIGARSIGIARHLPGAEKLFLAGLLHDVGRLVLLSRAPAQAAEIFALHTQRRMLLSDAERKILGYDHAQIGEQLLRTWRFPPGLVSSVAHHHQPMGAGVFQLDGSVVHIADYLTHAMQLGNSGERFVPPVNTRAIERVGLSPDMVAPVMNSIDAQIEEVVACFLPSSRKSARS